MNGLLVLRCILTLDHIYRCHNGLEEGQQYFCRFDPNGNTFPDVGECRRVVLRKG